MACGWVPDCPPRHTHSSRCLYRPGSPSRLALREKGSHTPASSDCVYVCIPHDTPMGSQPHLFLRRFSSLSSVITCRAPVQPSGWPKATAPPKGFTFSGGMPSFSTQ